MGGRRWPMGESGMAGTPAAVLALSLFVLAQQVSGSILPSHDPEQSWNNEGGAKTANSLEHVLGPEEKRGYDAMSGLTFGKKKRNFDEIDRHGFGAFAKRNFDEIDRAGFNGFHKRNFDEIDRSGFRGFQKRNFDEIDRSGFNGFMKRNFDEIDRNGFSGFHKRNFDEIDRSGFSGFAKRAKKNFDEID